MYVTEDTTRADPETLRRLYSTAIRAGASRVCIADTVGHATPAGAAAVVRFVAQVVDECGGGVGIDWHGHRDRDLAVVNTLAALEAGATRAARRRARHRRARRQHADGPAARQPGADGLHRARPVGARRVLRGRLGRDRRADSRRTTRSSAATRSAPPPASTPRRSSRPSRRTIMALVDAVYSGVPASLVGREQEIEVGPMSGKSNVVFWLEQRGLAGDRRHRRAHLCARRRRRRRCSRRARSGPVRHD